MASNDLTSWIGRTENATDIVSPFHVAGLRSVLGYDDCAAGDHSLGQCGHWVLAPTVSATQETGPDGHIKLGKFLPPVPLPRRMWAASKIEFHIPIRQGMHITRRSRVTGIKEKQGSTGGLVFVDVQHIVATSAETLTTETQTIVYREPDSALRASMPFTEDTSGWELQRVVRPSPITLFRYSALTFNSHRIHYDAPYARDVEGYRDLVVHGPLVASLLADLVTRHFGPDTIKTYAFRGQSPGFVGEQLSLRGKVQDGTVTLVALREDGCALMTAEARV